MQFFTQMIPSSTYPLRSQLRQLVYQAMTRLMRAKLIGVPGSHPCLSVELMLRHKGVEYTRLDLPNMTHKALAAAARLPRLAPCR